MAEPAYQLLDFGRGRRLERFGAIVVDRPAEMARRPPALDRSTWQRANARFVRAARGPGKWIGPGGAPSLASPWSIEFAGVRFELKLAPSGQIGLFPEHAEVGLRMAAWCRSLGRPARVLNLFAYTGGATLALAASGAEVVHVDAARSVVAWARRNAELSGLSSAPVRWITEDARRFVEREIARRQHYDGVLLDPPSYGHGPAGEPWKLEQHLGSLLANVAKLLSPERACLALSSHTRGCDPSRLADELGRHLVARRSGRVSAESQGLATSEGRRLELGAAAWWESA